MFWPLSVQNFRSQTVINVQPVESESWAYYSKDDLLSIFVRCVQMETSADKIGAMINEVGESTPIRARALDYRDFEKIHQSIQVGVLETHNGLQLVLGFDGLGYEDERAFLSILSERVSGRLIQVQRADDGQITFEWPQAKLDRAIHLANQVRASSGHYESDASSSFHLASSRSISDATLHDDSKALAEVLTELKQQSNSLPGNSLLAIGDVSKVATQADGAQPGLIAIVIALITSLGLAGVVAWHLDPFADRGFQSVTEIEDTLGVPVVAQMKSADNSPSETSFGWANRVTEVTATLLFAILVAVIGFSLIDSTIRTSFIQSPYEGLTRIVQIFMGY